MTHPAGSAEQQHMPRRRNGVTTAVTIGGERFYLTANGREDGTLGEVFIRWGKQGQTQAGPMDIYAMALSVGLQHGVPLTEFVRQGLNLYFVPNGHTDDPDIPRVRSVVDWVVRRPTIDWLPYRERAALGIYTMDERMTNAADRLAAQGSQMPAPAGWKRDNPRLEAFYADLAGGIGSPTAHS